MIAILGSGVMGKGIAIELAKSNYKVVLYSAKRHLSESDLLKEIDTISSKYTDLDIEMLHKNIILTNSLNDIKDCTFVIEAVSENLDIKRDIIFKVKNIIAKDVIYASNTSSLSIEDIFKDLIDLSNVCGLHFFNPVHSMKLVELSYLKETSESTIKFAKELAMSIDKEVVLVKNSPGFIVNRLLIPMINEAAKLLDEGVATKEDIDKAMKFGANHPMGPLKLSDLIGNDIIFDILHSLNGVMDINISHILENLVVNKKLGRKTKSGFYDYK